MMRRLFRRHALLPFFALAACSRAPTEPAGATTATPTAPETAAIASAPPAPAPAPKRDLALLWNDPPGFVRANPKSPARAAEYVVPRAGADAEDAECVVMTFGPHQGGSVEDNAKRWVDQFQPAAPKPRRTTIDTNGIRATFVEVSGTFAGNMMPNAQGVVTPTSKPGWRLIGAILEAPSGLWFFKMTGPDLTVRAAAHQFEDMVRSARPK
ncbi:MAG TPA: hypothetical protein VN894_06725 [Polyangiaceae bacterium]|nr:hypothetical protein [Polyangiaceae bacterium]